LRCFLSHSNYSECSRRWIVYQHISKMAKSLTSYSRNRKATSKLSDVASSRPNVVVECNQKPIFGFDMVGGCTALSLSVPQKVGEAWLNVDPIGIVAAAILHL
jgi:hypothetical protein